MRTAATARQPTSSTAASVPPASTWRQRARRAQRGRHPRTSGCVRACVRAPASLQETRVDGARALRGSCQQVVLPSLAHAAWAAAALTCRLPGGHATTDRLAANVPYALQTRSTPDGNELIPSHPPGPARRHLRAAEQQTARQLQELLAGRVPGTQAVRAVRQAVSSRPPAQDQP